ncbi:MAG: enolase C-terminal domain-like protein [Halobacteriaceae archaeon]
MRVTAVDAWEVLDSRGDPTVRVRVAVDGAGGDGVGTFTVPSGASTGAHEAVERRDGDDRYRGRGVREACAAARGELADAACGRDPTDQRALDAALVDRDGTDDLSRLGANAVLGVSGAVAHAAADARDRPLYAHLADVDERGDGPGPLPTPTVNVLSGGLHAEGGIEIQDFLVVPVGAADYPDALAAVWSVRAAVRDRLVGAGRRPLVADEGGFAPPLASADEAFALLADAARDAGLEPGEDGDVAFAVDVAATHFHDAASGTYRLESLGRELDAAEMVDLVAGWVEDWPLVSVEDPLAEDDWAAWRALRDRVGDGVQVLGDDLLVTDANRLRRAVETDAATAVLVKPNQAGTLTRATDVVAAARDAGVAPVVSARSGETRDATVADLAVATGAGQLKVGSLARSERLAKYNRLLGLAHRRDLGFATPFTA